MSCDAVERQVYFAESGNKLLIVLRPWCDEYVIDEREARKDTGNHGRSMGIWFLRYHKRSGEIYAIFQ